FPASSRALRFPVVSLLLSLLLSVPALRHFRFRIEGRWKLCDFSPGCLRPAPLTPVNRRRNQFSGLECQSPTQSKDTLGWPLPESEGTNIETPFLNKDEWEDCHQRVSVNR